MVRRRGRARGVVVVLAAGMVSVLLAGGARAVVPDRGPTAGQTTVSGSLSDVVTFTEVSAGYGHTVAIGSDGVAYAWGENSYGQLGHGDTREQAEPVVVQAPAGVEFTAVSAGGSHSLAVGSDGLVYAWGHGYYGQLGNGLDGSVGSGAAHYSPIPVPVDVPAEGAPFTAVSAGAYHSVAIGSDGVTYAWGQGAYGRLGNGGTQQSSVPVAVHAPDGVQFTAVSAAYFHSVAIGSDGVTYAWGVGANGLLGDGGTQESAVPVAVRAPAGVQFTAVSAGYSHSLAIGSDGVTYAWGGDRSGQLGDGNFGAGVHSPVPVAVDMPEAGLVFTAVSAGGDHSLALGSDGRTYAWGEGGHGRLGNDDTQDSAVPVAVHAPEGVEFIAVSDGDAHALAVGSDGVTYAWGDGSSSRLGNGRAEDVWVPGPVAMTAVVDSVTFGGVAGDGLAQTGPDWTVTTPAHHCGVVEVAVTWTQLGRTRTDTVPGGFTFGTAPVVTVHPESVDLPAAGGQVTLTAAAEGDAAPHVQWQRAAPGSGDWSAVPDATEPTFTTRASQPADYRAVFTNCLGEAATDPAAVRLTGNLAPGADDSRPTAGPVPGDPGTEPGREGVRQLAGTGAGVVAVVAAVVVLGTLGTLLVAGRRHLG